MEFNRTDIMIYNKHFAGTHTPKRKKKYLECFYKNLSEGVKANLNREYYDRLISGFNPNKRLNTEQMQHIDDWHNYSVLEKEYISKSKRILHELNLISNRKSSDSDYENALFDLAFIIEKRNQHIDKFNRIVQSYKNEDNEKYEQGLIILKKLDEEYNVRIKEGLKNICLKSDRM